MSPSRTDNTIEDWRGSTSEETRGVLGAVRRMAVKLTRGAVWQVLGHLMLDSKTRESKNAEVFSGVGFFSRPRAGANAEAIVVFPGGPANPIVIATRDEDSRRKVDSHVPQGATAVFSSAVSPTMVLVRPDSTVEVRNVAGVSNPLPTLAGIQAIVDKLNELILAFNTHTHAVTGGGTVAVVSVNQVPVPAPDPVPTTVLRSQ